MYLSPDDYGLVNPDNPAVFQAMRDIEVFLEQNKLYTDEISITAERKLKSAKPRIEVRVQTLNNERYDEEPLGYVESYEFDISPETFEEMYLIWEDHLAQEMEDAELTFI